MIRRYTDFKSQNFKGDKVPKLRESFEKKSAKKKVNEKKMVDAEEDKPESVEQPSRVNFLGGRKQATTIEEPIRESKRETPMGTPIADEFPTPRPETKKSPALNEGSLSKEFLENLIGRPLSGAKKEEPVEEKISQTVNPTPQRIREERREPKKEKKPIREKYQGPGSFTSENVNAPDPNYSFEEPTYRTDNDFTDQNFTSDEETIKRDPMAYKIFRDRSETFECRVHVEGSTLGNTKVRLLIESSEWNVYFNGKMTSDGRCVIPLKKMSILSEGLTGKIMLEVTVEDTVFYPWQETFQVQMSKKVRVEILSGQSQKQNGPKVRVSGI